MPVPEEVPWSYKFVAAQLWPAWGCEPVDTVVCLKVDRKDGQMRGVAPWDYQADAVMLLGELKWMIKDTQSANPATDPARGKVLLVYGDQLNEQQRMQDFNIGGVRGPVLTVAISGARGPVLDVAVEKEGVCYPNDGDALACKMQYHLALLHLMAASTCATCGCHINRAGVWSSVVRCLDCTAQPRVLEWRSMSIY
eukprot:m.247891 g.247891  ORF g.247891 m.247891 type:complete len:196 (+) comp15554_c0_seq1:138-725(+)